MKIFSKKQESVEAKEPIKVEEPTAVVKQETQSVDPILPPTGTVVEPESIQVQYVEREISLSLLNSKINELNSKLDWVIQVLSQE